MIALVLSAVLLAAPPAKPARRPAPARSSRAATARPAATPKPAPTPAAVARSTPMPTPTAPAPVATPSTPAVATPGSMRVISVTVADEGGTIAYVKPGEKAGLGVGTVVQFGAKAYKVTEVSAESASVALDPGPLAIGAVGQATVSAVAADRTTKLRATHAGETPSWNPPVRPVTFAPRPKPVPLSAAAARSEGVWNAVVTARGSMLAPSKPSNTLGTVGTAAAGALDARATARFGKTSPLGADVDLSAFGWSGPGLPSGAKQRPTFWVREAELRWGDYEDPYAAAGRLRRAAWLLGTIDGARVRVPIGGFSIGAFGGALPDPQSGQPGNDAMRFGTELSWRASDLSWRPEVELVASGSQFKGQLDERRVAASVNAFGTHAGAMGYAELSAFDKDNPWNAKPIELTAAGADLSVRAGPLRLGIRGDTRLPERSLWLQAHLPPTWLCTTTPLFPSIPGIPETCAPDQRRWLGAADAELSVKWIAWSVGATSVSEGAGPKIADSSEVFTDLRTVALPRGLRVAVGAHAGQGWLVDDSGGYVSAGRSFLRDRLDLDVTLRHATYVYVALPDTKRDENRLEGELRFAARANVDLGLFADLATGSDSRSSFVLFTTTWHAH